MRQLLILADDLSGAADCAIASMCSGLRAVVALDEPRWNHPADVLSIDCDSRHLEPDEAAERVQHVMRSCNASHLGSLVFKKVDSLLRGNVAAELASVLAEQRQCADAGQRIVVIMAPAFPAAGRTTVGGWQWLHGAPLDKTEVWACDSRPSTPHIPSLMANAGLQSSTIDLKSVRSNLDTLRASMLASAVAADVLVCDAETDEDLHAVASAALSLGAGTVWAGSAGLARQLSLAATLRPESPPAPIPSFRNGPSLFVIGSTSGVAREQASQLARHPAVNTIDVPPRTLLAGSSTSQWGHLAREISISLKLGRDTLVMVSTEEYVKSTERRLVTAALGVMLHPFGQIAGALVASGGETARAVLAAWGITSLQVLGEVETGLPYSIANFGELAIPVLTKAGSFGTPESLLTCRDFLDKLDRGPRTVRSSWHKL